MKTYIHHKHRFVTVFNPKTGLTVRSGVFDEHLHEGEDPLFADYPELLDIGVMGHCLHGLSGLCALSKVECYQRGAFVKEENMSIEMFEHILDQCEGKVLQVALGGRGDPDQHEHYERMLRYCVSKGVVPNYTTSGLGLSDEHINIAKQTVGAIAISWYRQPYTLDAIHRCIKAGIKTNIHYCLSTETLDEAIELLKHHSYPKGINRIIFLLHKPIGQGTLDHVLQATDPRVRTFFELFDDPIYANLAGFDSCSVPGLLMHTRNLDPCAIEGCEAGRFSAYITPEGRLYPCSFMQEGFDGIDLGSVSLQNAWDHPTMEQFRERYEGKCTSCSMKNLCLGGCPILPVINLCFHKERWDIYEGTC